MTIKEKLTALKKQKLSKKQFIEELEKIGFSAGLNEDTEKEWNGDGKDDTCISIKYPGRRTSRKWDVDTIVAGKRKNLPHDEIIEAIISVMEYEYKNFCKDISRAQEFCRSRGIDWDFGEEPDGRVFDTVQELMEFMEKTSLYSPVTDEFIEKLAASGIQANDKEEVFEETFFRIREENDNPIDRQVVYAENRKTGERDRLISVIFELEDYKK